MRYLGVNQVFRFDEGRTSYFYVAPTEKAAAKAHAKRPDAKKDDDAAKPVRLDPETSIGVAFDDCAEAIARIMGDAQSAALIRQTLQGVPAADEPIVLKRAADHWARMARPGDTVLLSVL